MSGETQTALVRCWLRPGNPALPAEYRATGAFQVTREWTDDETGDTRQEQGWEG